METIKIICLNRYLEVLDSGREDEALLICWLLDQSYTITASVIRPPKDIHIANAILFKINENLYVLVDCISTYRITFKDGLLRLHFHPVVNDCIKEILGAPRAEKYQETRVSFAQFWMLAKNKQPFIQTKDITCVSLMYYKYVEEGEQQYMEPIASKLDNERDTGFYKKEYFEGIFKNQHFVIWGLQALTCLVCTSKESADLLLGSDAKDYSNIDLFTTLVQTQRSKAKYSIYIMLDEYLANVPVYKKALKTVLNLLGSTEQTQVKGQRKEVALFEDRFKEIVTHNRMIKELHDMKWDYPLLIEEYEPFRFWQEVEEGISHDYIKAYNIHYPTRLDDKSTQCDESPASPVVPAKQEPAPIPQQYTGELEESTHLSYTYIVTVRFFPHPIKKQRLDLILV